MAVKEIQIDYNSAMTSISLFNPTTQFADNLLNLNTG